MRVEFELSSGHPGGGVKPAVGCLTGAAVISQAPRTLGGVGITHSTEEQVT